MKFKTKITNIFLDPTVSIDYNLTNNEKVNVIVSPSLYWVKKIKLPVKYIREAKKLLPSIFEDILPPGNYSYSVYKVEDYFYIFAYEDTSILAALSKINISISSIVNIYFAQSEIQNLQTAVKINETQSLYIQDDILVLVPANWVQTSEDLNLSALELSKHKITLQHYAHILEKSSLYKIGAIFVVLCIILFAEYLITMQKVSEVSNAKDELFVKYALKPTMFQNKSMLKKYKAIHEKQTKIREYTSYVLSLKLLTNEKLSSVNLKEKSIHFELLDISKQTLLLLERKLKAKNVKYKVQTIKNTLYVEIPL